MVVGRTKFKRFYSVMGLQFYLQGRVVIKLDGYWYADLVSREVDFSNWWMVWISWWARNSVNSESCNLFLCGSCGREDVPKPEGSWGLQKMAVEGVMNLFQHQLFFLLLFIAISGQLKGQDLQEFELIDAFDYHQNCI